MEKRILIAVIACAIYATMALPAMGQQRIHGHVFDAQTNKPVEGANVRYDTNKGTVTNANGDFYIPCSDRASITISYIGYHTVKKTVGDCSGIIRIPLSPSSYSLQKSTVQDRAYIKRAASIGTLDAAELNRQTGLRLKDALNTIPGVEMQTRSPFGGQRITIRGYYPNAGNNANFNGLGYQLYFNNIPVTDATGTTIMDDVDFSNLGRVNIIKGPSPLYGNEIAGTVQLYSKQPEKYGATLSEQAITGSYGLFRNNTALMTKSDNMDLTINYGRQTYDSFRPHDESKKDYLSMLAHFNVSDNQKISAYFSYNHSDEDLAGNIDSTAFYSNKTIANPDYVNNDGGVNIKSVRAGVTSNHSFNTHFENKTTVFATGNTLDQNFAHGFNYYNNLNYGARTNFTYREQSENIGLNGQLGAFIQRSTESVDGVFIPPSIHPPFGPDTEPQFPSNKQNYALNYNIFSKWKFELPQNFDVTVGGLLNFNRFGIRDMLSEDSGQLYSGSKTKARTFDPTFNPAVSVLKSFGNQASVYARLTTGKTPPLLGDIIQGDGSINEQLESEHAVQYEVGSKGSLLNNRLSYKLALFDLKIKNRLTTQYRNETPFTTNVGEQQNRGLELSVDYNLLENPRGAISLLRLWSSYTYSDFTYSDFRVFDNTNSATANYTDNDVAGVAPHRLNVGADLQTRPGFYLHAKYKYMDKTPVTFNNDHYVQSYNLLSGRLGYEHDFGAFNLNAFVGSNNITGSTYYNFLFVGQNRDALGDGYISPAPYDATVYGGATLMYNF